MDKKTNKKKLGLSFIICAVLFVIIFLNISASSIIFAQINVILDEKISEAEEIARPADINIIVLSDKNCQDCFNVKPIIEKIKERSINIKEEKELQREDNEAKKLIDKFKIDKLPTFLISGELEKDSALKDLWPKIGEIKENTFIFKQTGTPYVNAASGEIRGKVKLTVVSASDCANCFNASLYENFPKQMRMSVEEKNTVEYNSSEGKDLIKKYGIESAPTIIISGDIGVYQTNTLKKLGKIENDAFILTEVNPPYILTASGKLMGKLNLTTVSDKNCGSCYSVNVYDNIIKQFGLFVQNKKEIDINSNSGKTLVEKYKIEFVPTIIITGDFGAYNKPNSIWNNIGTAEKDGTYVLRENGIKQLGAYKNLVSGEIIDPANNKN